MIAAPLLGSLLSLLAPGSSTANPDGDFAVFLERGAAAYRPAARLLAEAHTTDVREVDPGRLRDPSAFVPLLRTLEPRFAVFVVRPETLDVDLAHALLAASLRVDDDPFPDVAFGFVTGRDGEAALAFAARTIAAHLRSRGRRAGLLATWEGLGSPPSGAATVLAALGLEGECAFVPAGAFGKGRAEFARRAVSRMRGKDVLLFSSHGWPDRMVGCFDAADLRAWRVDLAPAVLVHCACYNGVTGRWFAAGPKARLSPRPAVSRDASIALAFLETGITAYVAGLDEWHGPLADLVFFDLVDDGVTLGEAVLRPACRLAFDLFPDRFEFAPSAGAPAEAEGRAARRRRLLSPVLFGDPSYAPFARKPARLWRASALPAGAGRVTVRIDGSPLVSGGVGPDLHVAHARLLDPTSVRTSDWTSELTLEVYRVADWPEGAGAPLRARVTRAASGATALPTGAPQVLIEETPDGRRAHVRVPIRARAVGDPTSSWMALHGFEIRLEIDTTEAKRRG